MKLNIGCGKEVLAGWINTDVYPMSKEIEKLDITKFPLPYKDNTFSRVKMRNVLEHIPIDKQLNFFHELYRICKPGARIWIRVPYGNHWTRRIDHYRGYTYATFERIDSYWFGHKKRFKIVKKGDHPTVFGRLFLNNSIRRFMDRIGLGSLVITDIVVVLKVINK